MSSASHATLRYHGHCAFELRVAPRSSSETRDHDDDDESDDDGLGVLFDPWRDPSPPGRWFEPRFPRLPRRIDVVASTHPHFDHDAVEAAARGHDEALLLRGGTADFRDETCDRRSFGGSSSSGDDAAALLSLTAVTDEHAPASHAVWSVGRPAMRNTMFVVEMIAGGLRVLHMGDNRAELPAARLKQLGRIDVLFLTVDDACHLLTFEQVTLLELTLRPRVIIPMHYAIDGLTHCSAIEPQGSFGGNGLGRLESWLEQRAEQGGIVRRIPSNEPLRLNRSDLPSNVSSIGCGLAETWVMDVWRDDSSTAARDDDYDDDYCCQPCSSSSASAAAAAEGGGVSYSSL
jgi:L-ascorbate metabolism protein UlaG (beta-lactamase superfamily)